MNDELKEKVEQFLKEYDELRKKHGIQLFPIFKYRFSAERQEWNSVGELEAVEYKE
jgi:hypothetical protein